MKRLTFAGITALLVVLSTPSFSQFSVGPKAGINFNSFRNSATFKNYFDVIPGFNAGVFVKRPVLSFLTARVELLYMQQGANLIDYHVVSELSRRKSVARFHNIAVPVLAEFGLPSLQEDILQPKLILGGFYSHTVLAEETFDNYAKISGRTEVVYEGRSDLGRQFNESQYGLIGAIAADVKMFNKPVSLEFRYQYNVSRANRAGSQGDFNLMETTKQWGDKLYLHTLSINAAVTLYQF